ncbi:nanos homolog 3 isoform X2 [Chelonus insularis]|uniref:nanos homolog 3 isoform X2 n=1 Tax=Chelonus insularis TaxID=460826 RepID=UPI00158D6B05|nr:nanos homolog 3 isoform X2 [Chelonus insularis]
MMKVVVLQHQLPMPNLANSFFPTNPSLEDELRRLFVNFSLQCQQNQSQDVTPSVEEIRDEFRQNGKDYEYCPELETGELPECTYRRKRKKPLPTECVFCKNNGEDASYYKKHILKDADGIVKCPVLREYKCPICGTSGDHAHTIKYCPMNKNPEVVPIINTLKEMRNSTGKKRTNGFSFHR